MHLHCQGYTALLGQDELSWGWDTVNQRLHHGGQDMGSYPLSDDAAASSKLSIPCKFLLILDMNSGTVAFASADRRYYGVAFSGLTGLTLFPAVSAVWGHCEVSIRYIGGIGGKVLWTHTVCGIDLEDLWAPSHSTYIGNSLPLLLTIAPVSCLLATCEFSALPFQKHVAFGILYVQLLAELPLHAWLDTGKRKEGTKWKMSETAATRQPCSPIRNWTVEA